MLSPPMIIELKQESMLVDSISEIAERVKVSKNRVKNNLKHNLKIYFKYQQFKESLQSELQMFSKKWPQTSSCRQVQKKIN